MSRALCGQNICKVNGIRSRAVHGLPSTTRPRLYNARQPIRQDHCTPDQIMQRSPLGRRLGRSHGSPGSPDASLAWRSRGGRPKRRNAWSTRQKPTTRGCSQPLLRCWSSFLSSCCGHLGRLSSDGRCNAQQCKVNGRTKDSSSEYILKASE